MNTNKDQLYFDDKTGECYSIILVNEYKMIRLPGDQENIYHLINENVVNNDNNRFWEYQINHETVYIDKYDYHLCKHGKITRSYSEFNQLDDLLQEINRIRDNYSSNPILNNELGKLALDLHDLKYPCYTCYTEY